jgi:hypothetical protein
VLVQDPPDAFTADPDGVGRDPGRVPVAVVAIEVGGQLTDAPVRERQAEPGRSGLGRVDQNLDVGVGDPPGTPGTPARRQHRQRLGVERVDDIADGVRIRGDQPRDHGTRVPDDDAMMISARRYRTLS